MLQVEHVTKTFASPGKAPVVAVHDVSFHLAPGEMLGLVGRSGCGKSTLARLCARLLPVTEGEIRLDGREITRVGGRQLRQVYREMQLVFQSPTASFDPRKTLGYGIGEGLRNAGHSSRAVEERVEWLLEQCGLPGEMARRYPHQVSGGQCQRAALARALAVEPRVLLLDEVTSALDVTAQQEMMELLERWRGQRQLSCLFISHNLALVERVCHRVLVMDRGRVVEEGTPRQLIQNPVTQAAQRLVEGADIWGDLEEKPI